MALVKALTPSGNTGFFRFTPPPNTIKQMPGVVVFKVRDAHGCGPDIQGKALVHLGPGKVEVTFMQDDDLMSFSDYVVRAGGQVIPSHQLEPYRAALQEWLE